MKMFSAFWALILMISAVSAATPRITVPPNFTEPQQQASALAIPPQDQNSGDSDLLPAQADIAEVVVITLCNNVVGLFVVDIRGGIHMAHFASKDDVTKVQALTTGANNKAIPLGCPRDPGSQPIF